MKIKTTGEFIWHYRQVLKLQPELREVIDQAVAWFKKNPKDTRLDTHELGRHMSGKWAFSITHDKRIVFEWVGKKTVRFLKIGDHTVVYARKRRKEK